MRTSEPRQNHPKFWLPAYIPMGRDSSVGTATGYKLDGPGIESRLGEIFCIRPDRPWGPLSLLYNGYRVFPGGLAAGADADHPPLLAPRSRISRAIPLLPLWAFGACYRANVFYFCLYNKSPSRAPICPVQLHKPSRT
jgi:hypothetical protein